jgi:hypothetical protein
VGAADVVVEVEEVVGVAVGVEDLFPGVEGFPDAGAFGVGAGGGGDVVDLVFEGGVFDDDDVLVVLADEVVDVRVRRRRMG